MTACISAPRRYRELVENLGVLADPALPVERIAALREHGQGVHAESARFNTLVRQPTRDAAAALRFPVRWTGGAERVRLEARARIVNRNL